MEVIDLIYNLFHETFTTIYNNAIVGIRFMSNTIGENIQYLVDELFNANFVGEVVADLVSGLLDKIPNINSVSTLEFMLGGALAVFTAFAIVKFIVSILPI